LYNYQIHQEIDSILEQHKAIYPLFVSSQTENEDTFYARMMANMSDIHQLYFGLYQTHSQAKENFQKLIEGILKANHQRNTSLKSRDLKKAKQGNWFLSNQIVGMSLYVDRFCGDLKNLEEKLPYFQKLGVNFLHLMPLFESPKNESDGGYAVSDFKKVDARFGTLEDLQNLQQNMAKSEMYLMLDIVLNHTSHLHEWAMKAKAGDKKYQDYFYMYEHRHIPEQFEQSMPEVFPDVAPGNFTYVEECQKWVMSVFHNYQWDLNYSNPAVLVEMLDIVYFYANLGVDILRIDAPAFIWKELGTTCQNLPEAHQILRLIRQCVSLATPGMAILGEAIVAPQEIMKYFGTDGFEAQECDFAYNATQMAVQWDALATGDVRVMMAAQQDLLKKPLGTSWITYTRCHDDIGLGYENWMIEEAGFTPYLHRRFLMQYYSGTFQGSTATGALFSVNPKTQDARISGTLASLCGLEKAIKNKNITEIDLAIQKIILMQAHSFFLGGVPMLFYGDELGYTNDYSYLKDDAKSYDNRWLHRPVIDWEKNKKVDTQGTIENRIFKATQSLIALRKKLPVFADHKNITWMYPHNAHIAGFLRELEGKKVFVVLNYSNSISRLTWYAFKEFGFEPTLLFDHWKGEQYKIGEDYEYLSFAPYQVMILESD
jgi:amylosucrase